MQEKGTEGHGRDLRLLPMISGGSGGFRWIVLVVVAGGVRVPGTVLSCSGGNGVVG